MSEHRSSVVFVLATAGAKAWLAVVNAYRTLIAPNYYRPEAHYMRGPGPKWRARHAQVSSRR
jgi:hypothetical protein